MQKMSIDELKMVQLDILQYVTQFCEERNIPYFLDSGTLLGAIRHQGYIPWDDDIDIGMLREDYERFHEAFILQNSKYKLLSYDLDYGCPFAFGKVLDTTTVLYEEDLKGVRLSVNIDIFPYDNAPDKRWKANLMYNWRDILASLHQLRMGARVRNGGAIKKLAAFVLRPIVMCFPPNLPMKLMVRNCKRYAKAQSDHVCNFTAVSRVFCSKEVFGDRIKVEFEGKLYDAPSGYDVWLKAFYGDYMQLPPVEKRCSHHRFEAYFDSLPAS